MYRLTVLISLLFISLPSIAQELPRTTQQGAVYNYRLDYCCLAWRTASKGTEILTPTIHWCGR